MSNLVIIRKLPSVLFRLFLLVLFLSGPARAICQEVSQLLRIVYVNTKSFPSDEAGRQLDFASFCARAGALGGLNFNSIVFYQFHHFRNNPELRRQVLGSIGFAAKLIRERGEIPYGGTHIYPPLFVSDPQYRADLEKFFSEVKKQGAEPLAATGNTSWVAQDGRLAERPEFLGQLNQIAQWCTDRKIPLYVISDMATTYDAKTKKTQYPDKGDDGNVLWRVLDVANPVSRQIYRQFFENIANLRKKYPAIIAAGLEEFPEEARFLQDDKPVLYGFSDDWKLRFSEANPGRELPRYNSLGGPGNATRMEFLDTVTSEFFAKLAPSEPGFQVTHLDNYTSNWRYKMSVPPGNLSGDPYVYDTWMLPAPVTFLQPSMLAADPSLAEGFHLLMLHPRGRAMNQWHLERRTAQFGTDRVAASWPFFMAGAAPPLVGYEDQLLKVLPHFAGILILPYRITSDQEDDALAAWVRAGNILVLGSFAGEGADGRLDPAHVSLPAKWTAGGDHLLKALEWTMPQNPKETVIKGDPTVRWTNAFAPDAVDTADLPLTGMAGRSLASPEVPNGTKTFASINGTPYIQGRQLGKGWVIWHDILPFADSEGRLSARYDSQEGWLGLRALPTRLLRAGLEALRQPVHRSDTSLIFGNGRQSIEVDMAKDPAPDSPGYRMHDDAAGLRPQIQWSGDSASIRPFWETELSRYWPSKLPAGHFLNGIDRIDVDVDHSDRDGFSIAAADWAISIKAANPRSALLGLYHLLEKVGWRWIRPGVDRFSGDWIVRNPSELSVSMTSALALRGMMTHTPVTEDTLQWVDWLPKAGFNFFLIPGPYWDSAPSSVKKALADRQLIVEVGAHSFDFWYPHQRYFPIAPETFALVKGSRQLPATRWIDDLLADRQVATTNPAVPPAFARAMDDFAQKNPSVARISLWPNDGFGWDESPEARALDQDGICLLHPGIPNYARRYLHFIRAVQGLRHTETPATIIAYAATLQFPKGETIPKGLPVYVAPYLENYAAPLAQSKSPANACYWDETRKWIAAGAQVTLFEYWLKYAWLSQPLPVIGQQKENIRALAAAGGSGLLTQAELDGWDVNAPLYYVGGRLLMDPNADVPTLVSEYFQAEAGKEAGSLLTQFWEDLENQPASTGELTAFGANLPKVFTPDILKKWDQMVARLNGMDSPEAREAAQRWGLRRDVIGRILNMITLSGHLANEARHDRAEGLTGYEKLVLLYDQLLSDLRDSPLRKSFDPLLPKFLASNVLRPVVKRLQSQGVVIPEELVRDGRTSAL